MYKHVLIPTDGSVLAQKAVGHGLELAKTLGARVTALTVEAPFHVFAVEPGIVTETLEEYTKHIKAHAKNTLDLVADAAKKAGVACDTLGVENDRPFEAIIKTARDIGCDLIVMASHGRRGVSAVLLGSETVRVLTHSTIPVLVYR